MRLNEIFETYRDDVQFLCLYIKEAHPEDSVGGYRSSNNAAEGIVINQHIEIEDRAEEAATCVLRLNLKMPMALDDMSNQVEDAYRAFPDRLFLLDAEGRITYHSEQGPFGFLPGDWEAAIKDILVQKTAAELE